MNADMTCGHARRLLWPDGGPRPASREMIDAQEHFATCAECQRFRAQTRAMGDAIHESAPREQAPAAVRERLFAALAHARTGMEPPRHFHSRSGVLLAVAVLVVIAAAAFFDGHLTRDPMVDTIGALAADHARAVGEAHVASTDPLVVRKWLTQRVHFGMQVPILPGASLRGARISVFEGRRSAVLEYDVGGTGMSYFVIPNEPRSSDAHMRFDQTAREGYHIISWREPDLLHAMVGNLSASQLLTLAKACVEQAGRGVA